MRKWERLGTLPFPQFSHPEVTAAHRGIWINRLDPVLVLSRLSELAKVFAWPPLHAGPTGQRQGLTAAFCLPGIMTKMPLINPPLDLDPGCSAGAAGFSERATWSGIKDVTPDSQGWKWLWKYYWSCPGPPPPPSLTTKPLPFKFSSVSASPRLMKVLVIFETSNAFWKVRPHSHPECVPPSLRHPPWLSVL